MSKKENGIVGLIVILLLGYLVSPWVQLLRIKNAFMEQDVVGLERYVDWTTVRNGLKEDMTALLGERVASKDDDFVKGMALLLGPTIIDRIVSTVSAATTLKFFQKNNLQETWGNSDAFLFNGNYTAIDEFSVWLKDGSKSRIVMSFDHFQWVVKRVVLDGDMAKILAELGSGQEAGATNSTASNLANLELPKNETFHFGQNALRIHYEDQRSLYGNEAFLNDKSIVQNDYVHLYKALPNEEKPELVILANTCSGTACTFNELTVVDLSTTPPVFNSEICVPYDDLGSGSKDDLVRLSYSKDMLKIDTETCDKNKFGDQIKASYIYDRKIHALYRDGDFDKNLLSFANQHPDVLFSEGSIYRPNLVKLLGDQFRDVRDRLGMSDSIQIKEGKYLFSSGCMRHACGTSDDQAAIIIDLATKEAWVAWTDSGIMHFRLTKPLAELNEISSNDYDVSHLLTKWGGDIGAYKKNKTLWMTIEKELIRGNFDLEYNRTNFDNLPTTQKMTMQESLLLKRQISSCWLSTSKGLKSTYPSVDLIINVNPNRSIRDASVENQNRAENDPSFRLVAESAIRALKEKDCQTLDLPISKFDVWKTIRFRFDPKVISQQNRSSQNEASEKALKPLNSSASGVPPVLIRVISDKDWPFVRQALQFAFSLGEKKEAVNWENSGTGTTGSVYQSGDGVSPDGCRQFRVTNLSAPNSISSNIDVCADGGFR